MSDMVNCPKKLWVSVVVSITFVLLQIGTAESAELRYIRVGEHKTHTRIVFEFRGFADFKEPVVIGKGRFSVVFVGTTTSLPKQILSETTKQVDAIEFVQDKSQLTANVILPFPYFEIKSFTLSNPHRVLLDIAELSIPPRDLTFDKRTGEVGPQLVKDTTPPTIKILQPPVTRGIKVDLTKKNIWVKGIAQDKSGVHEVLVNDREARLSNEGDFAAEVLLRVGDNEIRVLATDTKGNSSEKTLVVFRKQIFAADPVDNSREFSAGKYFALLIACQEYLDPSLLDLDNPIRDVSALKILLIHDYSFDSDNVVLLTNPDRKGIFRQLEELSSTITAEDSLLIFYAGHGLWDKRFRQGYWLPSNASKTDRSEWIPNSTIRDFIRGIESRHTLLVADACFSGAIFKSRKAFAATSRAIQELQRLPSRKAITSGAFGEVPDRSTFVEYLLKRLRNNTDKYLPSETLFSRFREAVINNSPISQIPQFGVIREAGDEGGDFIFIMKQ